MKDINKQILLQKDTKKCNEFIFFLIIMFLLVLKIFTCVDILGDEY